MFKKLLFESLLFIVVFLGAALSFNYIFNRSSKSRAVEGYNPTMEKAYILYKDKQINTMLGYKDSIDTSLYRDSIVPLDSEKVVNILLPDSLDRGTGVRYELRSFDGSNLIEEGDFRFVSGDEGMNKYTTNLRMDMTDGEEYSFVIKTSPEGDEVSYYTRVVRFDSTYANELINYAISFSDAAYIANATNQASSTDATATYNISGTLAELNKQQNEKAEKASIATTTDAMIGVNVADISKVFGSTDAMSSVYTAEGASNVTSDGNPGFVTLSSSYEDVTYRGMKIERLSDPIPKLKEVSPDSATIELKYKAISIDGNDAKTFAVSEYFTLEYNNGAAAINVNDYKRYVNQDFNEEGIDYMNSCISLGITSEHSPEFLADEATKRLAFVADNSIWLYNNATDTYSSVYGTSTDEAEKERTPQEGYGIRLISIDEDSLDFIIYGRMNDGPREGKSGVALYEYSIKEATLREMVFISVKQELSAMKLTTGRFGYYDKKNRNFYTLIGDSLYKVDVFSGKSEELMTDIPANQILVSDNMKIIAYPDSRNRTEVNKITIVDFEKGTTVDRKVTDHKLALLGFVGEDIVYGAAKPKNIKIDIDESPIFYFDKICIVRSSGVPVKDYSKDNVLVSGVEFKENIIHMDRVSLNEETGEMEEINGDYISYKPHQTDDTMRLVVNKNEAGNQELCLKFPDKIYVSSGNEELFTKVSLSDRSIEFDAESPKIDKMAAYIYEPQGITDIYYSIGKAIRRVYDEGGTVVDAYGKTIFRKKIARAYYTVAGTFKYQAVDNDKESFAACNYMCINAAGLAGDYDDIRTQNDWEDSFAMYGTTVKGINLSGVKMDTAIGFLSDGIPFAAKIENRYVMVVSYNDEFIRYYDPVEDQEVRLLKYQFQIKCNDNGNEFYTFVK